METGNLSLGGLMDTIRLDVSELDLFAEISQDPGWWEPFFWGEGNGLKDHQEKLYNLT